MGLFDLQTKKTVLRNLLTAFGLAVISLISVSLIWKQREIRLSAALGLFFAWALSSVSLFFLSTSAHSSMRKFFKVWLGGILARVVCLGVLMAFAWAWPASSQAALLLSYCFGVVAFLFIESRDILSRARA